MAVSITVLMTVYNGGSYLPQAIESVLQQRHKEFEFLIIDDASTDDSLTLIHSYKDARIRVISHQQNQGQVFSLNEGLKEAKGIYVARMDADDSVSPHWLALLLPIIQSEPRYAVLSAQAIAVNDNGLPLRFLWSPRSWSDILLRILIASPINHVGCIMRRQVVLEAGGYASHLMVAADYDLWSRLTRVGWLLGCYPKVLIKVRYHGKSLTASQKGGLLIKEMTQVMGDNIKHFTSAVVSTKQTTDLWYFIYAPQTLSSQEYARIGEDLKEIYRSFKNDQVPPRRKDSFLERLLWVAAVKRFLGTSLLDWLRV